MVHTFEQDTGALQIQSSTHSVSLETHTAVKHEDNSTSSCLFFLTVLLFHGAY